MPNVIVTPPSVITVRVGPAAPAEVTSTASFVGASGEQQQIQQALNTANLALTTANTANAAVAGAAYVANAAYAEANTALSIAYQVSNNSNKLINASNAEVILEANNNLTVPGSIILPSNGALNFAGETVTVLTANVYNDITGLYLEDGGVAALYANSYIVIQTGEANPNGAPTWVFNADGSLSFPDNSLQSTAFNDAYISEINTTSNIAAYAANKANNALANTTGTFGGSLTISGNTTVFGTIYGNVATIDAGTF